MEFIPAELTLRSCTVDTACNRTSAVVQSGSRLLPAVPISWNERADSPAVGPRCGSTHFQLGPCLAPKWGGSMVYGFTERSSPTKRYQQTTLADLLKGSVHEGVLAQILLGGTQHDDLLQFLGVCRRKGACTFYGYAWTRPCGTKVKSGTSSARYSYIARLVHRQVLTSL